MKFCFLLLIIPLLHVSASTNAQNITINKENATLADIFRELRRQTDYDFLYSARQLANAKNVSINVTNAQLIDVLEKCFYGQPFTYTINQKTIAIKEKAPGFLDRLMDRFAAIDVRGIVLDDQGMPLAGATVTIKGTGRSTHTNDKGAFYLENVDEKAVIVITFLGYETKELTAGKELGNIILIQSDAKLEEVIINAGYYSVKERELTGNISKVTAETIGNQPVNNPLLALQGRVAGLQITQANGIAGGSIEVRIRGTNSIRSGNDPLYIIDGVIYPSGGISGTRTSGGLGTSGLSPLSLINPNDIQNIEVLKDGDATAIYGSRGANGVILITTKKGKTGETTINANFSHGIGQVGHRLDLLNTEEYLEMRKEAFANDGLQIGDNQYDVNGTYDENKYTDWQQELIGSTAQTANAAINIGGGTAKANYLIAGNYYKEGTVYQGDFNFKRFSVRSNINLGASEDRFNAGFTLNFNRTNSNISNSNIVTYILLAPNAPDPLDEFGKINWADGTIVNNPMAALLRTNDAATENLLGNFTASYRITDDLLIKGTLGYSSIKRNELAKTPLASNSPLLNSTASARETFFGNNYVNNVIFESQLNYKTKILAGSMDALVGMSVQDNDAQINVIRASNFTSDDLMENIASGANLANLQNDFSQYRYIAVFGRLNYNLAGKYLINLTGRRDGSSKFGPGRQFANFGALGAAWIISDEEFFKSKVPFLSFAKLRTSYGITGNDQIPNYGYLQLWNTSTVYDNTATLIPNTVAPNDEFSWETNRKLEAGMQLGFFKDKLNLEISYYRNRSSNQLILQSLPLSSGLVSVQQNLPAEIENKGWEIESDVKLITNKTFTWSAGFNITIPKNTLLSYPDLESSTNSNRYTIGEPLNITKTYNITLNSETGLYSVEDKNGNNIRDNVDLYLSKFLGQYLYGGLQNTLAYKNFSLDFHLTFTKQDGGLSLGGSMPGSWSIGTFSNQDSEVLKRWQRPGQKTNIQKFSTTSANSTLHSTAKNSGNISIVDASYIRLRNVALSYSLPKKLLSKAKIHGLGLSLRGQNLYTFTNFIGLDPETGGFVIPPLRTILLGLNLSL